MLTPRELLDIIDGSVHITDQLCSYLAKEMAERMILRLGRGEKYLLTSSDRWRIQIMQEAGYLYQDIIREIAKYTKLQQKEIQAAFQQACIQAIQYDDEIYKAAGLSPFPLWQSPHLVRLMERNYRATMKEWRNMTLTTANEAQKLFINECDLAYHKVSTGAVAYNVAVHEAIEKISENGFKIKYPSGREISLEAATAMVVRTGVAQAAGDIALGRMIEMGYDKVLVSSHMGSRPTHEVWQGGIYHVNWDEVRKVKPYLFEN